MNDLVVKLQAYKSIIEQQARKIEELQEDKERYERTLNLIGINMVELQNTMGKLFTIQKASYDAFCST